MKSYLILCLFVSSFLSARELPITMAAESVVLINAKTGTILYQKNPHERMNPASTTKVATTLYALHLARDQLDRKMTATQEAIASITPQAKKQSNYRSPPYWLETDGTHIGIKKGEEFTFHDLLYGIMLASGNDASNVVAQNLCGTIPKFMEGLNKFLKDLGCKNTTFNNPHGLSHPQHLTTAYDYAIVAREAMKDPLFRKIVSTVRYKCPQTNLQEERTFVQGNFLLRKGSLHYDKAIGIKTGYTSAAGKNLVAAAEDENRSLIAVVYGHRGVRDELYHDVKRMFDTAFNEKKMRRVFASKGAQTLSKKIKGTKQELKTYLSDSLFYDYYPSEEVPAKMLVTWDAITLPIAKDQQVGLLKLVDDKGNILSEKSLFAASELKATLCHSLFKEKKGRQMLFYACVGSFFMGIWFLRKKTRLTNSG